MSTLLIMRTHRVLLFSLAAVLIASLMSPMMGAATTDLAIGDAAVVSNNGNGANLRSSTTDLSDATISAEVPDGVIVYVADGPFVNEGKTWLWVETDLYGGGYISADLLVKRAETEEAAPVAPEVPAVGSNLSWLEPIDAGVVVDNNAELGEQGLPVLNDASYDAGVLGHAQPGAWFDVTSERVWVGDANFVRVNFNGAGAYVDGRFIALNSEAVVDEPTEEVVWLDEPTEVIVEQPAEDITEVPADQTGDAPTEEVTEVPADQTEEVTEVPSEEVTEAPAEDVTEVPAEDTTEVPATPESDDATEPAVDETVTEEAAPVKEAAPIVVASTANSFDPTTVIGSATVTGTLDGLVCRAAPDPAAPVLMTLAEGTKVQVFAEAVNGYLGIDCAGLQGFADVNYLWSGGAVDGQITSSQMTIVVTGTGSSLNCRAEASLSGGIITALPDGTVLTTRGAASNGWTPVVCGGKNGFVSTTWIEVKSGGSNSGNNTTGSTGSATVNTGGDGLYCRTGAGSSYGVITTLRHGATVEVRGAQQGSWLPVTCAGQAGFVHTDYINVSAGNGNGNTNPGNGDSTPTGNVTIVNTGGQRLNCRSGAGISYGVITSLALGQTVPTRSGSVSGWTAVVCGGQNGFVSSEFTSGSTGSGTTNPNPDPGTGNGDGSVSGPTGTATVNTGGDGLYCRSGAGSTYGVITSLPHGTQVTTRGNTNNGWVPIICGGSNGWASATYLTIGGSGNTNPGNGNGNTNPGGMAVNDHAKATANVNLRYEATTSSGVAVLIPEGTVILITGAVSNSFYPVDYDGLRGFVHQDYLTKTSEALSKRGGSGNPGTTDPGTTDPGNPNGSAMVNYAMRYIGYPYVWATHGPGSFDCSGFTYWVVKNVLGKNIGTGTWTQVAAGTPVSRNALQPGDLVFFQNTYTAGLSHVGMYIGNGQFIHAQNESTGVVISDLNSSYYAPRWYGAVRL